ncbi:MAG: PEP-CTERM sorting domain-containing protein [Planctomycetota bacterium]|nr:PEP-CTERM sorting domain-containing protein [Planctomycetota bacterium]
MTTTEFATLQSNNPGFDAPFGGGIYSQPQLKAADLDFTLEGGEKIVGPGMVMGWGDVGSDTYTAAWRYAYPLDPNVVGQTLTATVCPPRFALNGAQMNSIGFGLTDGAGRVRTWTWKVAAVANPAVNTIAWNQNWNVSIGPILGMIPPAVPPDPGSAVDVATGFITVVPIYFNQPGFNPANVMFLDGYENGGAAAVMPVPPGGIPNVAMWNWWRNVIVTPEPATLALLAMGALAILRRRR